MIPPEVPLVVIGFGLVEALGFIPLLPAEVEVYKVFRLFVVVPL